MSGIMKHESGRILIKRFWWFGWFGKVFLPYADFPGAWGWAKIEPFWYRAVKILPLFLSLINPFICKLDIDLAFKICGDLLRDDY